MMFELRMKPVLLGPEVEQCWESTVGLAQFHQGRMEAGYGGRTTRKTIPHYNSYSPEYQKFCPKIVSYGA